MPEFRWTKYVLLLLAVAVPVALRAQSSSINAFSPYTFYGVGDISNQGPAYIRSMGGAGIAYREPAAVNFLNPAALSAMPQKSFILNMSAEGTNYYLKNSVSKTSYNTFNVKDVAIQFPLTKGLAVGVSVTPFSSVGYRTEVQERDPAIIANIGDVRYRYVGDGDIAQLKVSAGWEIFPNFSVGAELIFYKGEIERSYFTDITPITGTGTYTNSSISQYLRVSRFNYNVGIQYNPVMNNRRLLTIGATYQPQVRLNPEGFTSTLESYSITYRSLELDHKLAAEFTLPHNIGAGIFYHNQTISLGADYIYQKWDGINRDAEMDGVTFRNTNTIKAGMSITPNRYDVRSFMKRLTYRVGIRYSDYYMKFNGHGISDKAITAGIGFPVTMAGLTNINVGVELGQRGTTRNGLIRENYFKFSVGFSLFGTDDWFKKYRYD